MRGHVVDVLAVEENLAAVIPERFQIFLAGAQAGWDCDVWCSDCIATPRLWNCQLVRL